MTTCAKWLEWLDVKGSGSFCYLVPDRLAVLTGREAYRRVIEIVFYDVR